MSLSTIDVAVVVLYAIGIFSLAQWVSRERAGHQKDTSDYFLASKNLPWWAIGASLIAANISAEQIVGMSGSGYAIGLAIASYEWMAAATLLIVGKFFLPIFLKNQIYTMPQFLQERYGDGIRILMTIFWLALYVFVNLTSIIWLGSIAVNKVAGVDQTYALIGLGVFALAYQLYGGLKAIALTDIVQVTLLVLGGLVVAFLTLDKIGAGHGFIAGFQTLVARAPDHFHMILHPTGNAAYDHDRYQNLPGLSVLIGGMWIANLSYWGFNQYIIQRALAAKSVAEAQKGVVFAAYLKLLMPVIIVVPGIAAVVLAPDLLKPDQAYPTMMRLLPPGPSRPRLLGPGRGDRRVDGVQDQFDRDHLHSRSLRQDEAPQDARGGRHRPGRQGNGKASGDGRPDRRSGCDHHRTDCGPPPARQFRPGVPVHPGIHRLLHAGDYRHLPSRPVLEEGD